MASQERGFGRQLDGLYRLHFQSLCANIRKSFGAGPPEPEDAVQAAFARFASLKAPGEVKDPRAFLYIAARNIVLDYKRRKKLRETYEHEQRTSDPERELEQITPERVVVGKEAFDLLVDAMKSLPQKQQVVLTMSRLEGKTYREICKETGWSLADVSRQMSLGMVSLVKAMRGQQDDEQ